MNRFLCYGIIATVSIWIVLYLSIIWTQPKISDDSINYWLMPLIILPFIFVILLTISTLIECYQCLPS